MQQSIWEEQSA